MVLADKTGLLSTVFNIYCREALGQMLEAQGRVERASTGMEKKVVSIQPDSSINILQLSMLDSLVRAGDIQGKLCFLQVKEGISKSLYSSFN